MKFFRKKAEHHQELNGSTATDDLKAHVIEQKKENSRMLSSWFFSCILHLLVLLLFFTLLPAKEAVDAQANELVIEVELSDGASSYKAKSRALNVKKAASALKKTRDVKPVKETGAREQMMLKEKPVEANSKTFQRKKLELSRAETGKNHLESSSARPRSVDASSELSLEKAQRAVPAQRSRSSSLAKKIGEKAAASSSELSSSLAEASSSELGADSLPSSKTSSASAVSSTDGQFKDSQDTSLANSGSGDSAFNWKKKGSTSRRLISKSDRPIPENLRGQGIQSEALILFKIDKFGKPFALELLRSSKYEELDVWLLQLVRSFRFNPVENKAVYEVEYLQRFEP